ncbi:hypothetical protein JTE90_022973 [Oedothorax gibbosus]|uniref:Uncharacterized protein n=1 Tax=Oedothorax gibbosus TaxID=931172 RepID=A0AAV6VBA8_9ARAC|nr:hypothetical protein JTE90_022973 [Oedothorax gibbosus]
MILPILAERKQGYFRHAIRNERFIKVDIKRLPTNTDSQHLSGALTTGIPHQPSQAAQGPRLSYPSSISK